MKISEEAKSLIDWLGVDCPEDIQPLIDEAYSVIKTHTGQDFSGDGKTISYIQGEPSSVSLPCSGGGCDEYEWQIERYSGGQWDVMPNAVRVGDTICLTTDCVSPCDMSACVGSPRYRLICWPKCGLPSWVAGFVRRYVSYHYMNRGDMPDAVAEGAIIATLKPYIPIAAF